MFLITDDPSQRLGGGNSNIFHYHPYLGKIPIVTTIFQMGWFNHQLYERFFLNQMGSEPTTTWDPTLSGNHFRWNVPHDGPIDQAQNCPKKIMMSKVLPSRSLT